MVVHLSETMLLTIHFYLKIKNNNSILQYFMCLIVIKAVKNTDFHVFNSI